VGELQGFLQDGFTCHRLQSTIRRLALNQRASPLTESRLLTEGNRMSVPAQTPFGVN
jgi:hypothetical protein